MPIDRITSAQFIEKLRTALLNRTKKYDTGYGSVPDVVIRPVANALEDQNNNRLRKRSLVLSLQNEEEFDDEDIDALAYNEGLIRPDGSQATAVLTFRRSTAFSASESGLIQRGFPVGTAADEATGRPVTFITTEAKDKTSAVAVLDTTTNTTVYELEVSAVALVTGSDGKVGAERINRPLRPLVGWTSVTNKEAAQEGRDRYTNAEMVELILLATSSRQLSVPTGSEFYTRDTFPAVEDVNEVFGTDPLLTRAATDAGAVDAFVLGENLISQTDQLVFLGVGQKMLFTLPPAVRVDTVTLVSGGTELTLGDDYELAFDTSGVSGSTRAKDGITILATCSPMPAVGDLVSVTYVYNQLIRDLQDNASDEEILVEGRDLLYRMATKYEVYLSAELTVVDGFTTSTIQSAVEETILSFVDALKLGKEGNVEGSDINAAVRRLSGVDNFVITKLVRDPTATGTADLVTAGNEYPNLDAANLPITLV